MIRFDKMDAATISAMCTPMHVVPLPHGANQQHLGTLWLGSFQAGSDPELLRQHHINHLVQVLDVPWLPTHTDLSIIVTRFDIMDVPSADLRSHLEEACARIDKSLKSGKNVLVHCQQVRAPDCRKISHLSCLPGNLSQCFDRHRILDKNISYVIRLRLQSCEEIPRMYQAEFGVRQMSPGMGDQVSPSTLTPYSSCTDRVGIYRCHRPVVSVETSWPKGWFPFIGSIVHDL